MCIECNSNSTVTECEEAGMVVGPGVTQARVQSWKDEVRKLRIKKYALVIGQTNIDLI